MNDADRYRIIIELTDAALTELGRQASPSVVNLLQTLGIRHADWLTDAARSREASIFHVQQAATAAGLTADAPDAIRAVQLAGTWNLLDAALSDATERASDTAADRVERTVTAATVTATADPSNTVESNARKAYADGIRRGATVAAYASAEHGADRDDVDRFVPADYDIPAWIRRERDDDLIREYRRALPIGWSGYFTTAPAGAAE